MFVVLVLFLTACANKEAIDNTQQDNSDEQGYIGDVDQELDNSDLNSLDEDLNSDWI